MTFLLEKKRLLQLLKMEKDTVILDIHLDKRHKDYIAVDIEDKFVKKVSYYRDVKEKDGWEEIQRIMLKARKEQRKKVKS